MNIINQNGLKIIQTKDWIEVDGIRTDIPKHVKSGWNNSLSMTNKTIIINGYVFDPTNKTFTRKEINFFFKIIRFLFGS